MDSIDQYFESGGGRIRFRDEGKGVPVVFLHGWTLDLEMWQPQASALSRQFRIIRFDRRGFGLSSGTPDPAQDVEDFRSLLDYLEIPQVAVIGRAHVSPFVWRSACRNAFRRSFSTARQTR